MKPKIGRKLYFIYGDGIFSDTVGFLGKYSFIVNSFNEGTNEDSCEWDYDDYNVQWFTTLVAAKKALIARFEDKPKIVKVRDGYWSVKE